jgi:hypothetical protein
MIKPQAPTAGILYEEQRLALQLTGRFEDLAGFAGELSALPWHLTLHSFNLVPGQTDMLRMDMVLLSLRSPHAKNSSALPAASALESAATERLRPATAPGLAARGARIANRCHAIFWRFSGPGRLLLSPRP